MGRRESIPCRLYDATLQRPGNSQKTLGPRNTSSKVAESKINVYKLIAPLYGSNRLPIPTYTHWLPDPWHCVRRGRWNSLAAARAALGWCLSEGFYCCEETG